MVQEYKDYYAILGVSEDADHDEVKRAYRKMARASHPDVNPDKAAATERFKDVNEANQVLSDPDKRRWYDQIRTTIRDGLTSQRPATQPKTEPSRNEATRYPLSIPIADAIYQAYLMNELTVIQARATHSPEVVAAKDVIPQLNLVMFAVLHHLREKQQLTESELKPIANLFSQSIFNLTRSNYPQGDMASFTMTNSVGAEYFAQCCEYVNNEAKEERISVQRHGGEIDFVFYESLTQSYDLYSFQHHGETRPAGWKKAFETYKKSLGQTNKGIEYLLEKQSAAVDATEFLSGTGVRDVRMLLACYEGYPELTPEYRDSIQQAVRECRVSFYRLTSDEFEQLDTARGNNNDVRFQHNYVWERRVVEPLINLQLSDRRNSAASPYYQPLNLVPMIDATLATLRTEKKAYELLSNPVLADVTILGAVRTLAELSSPVASPHFVTVEYTRSLTDWTEVQSVLTRAASRATNIDAHTATSLYADLNALPSKNLQFFAFYLFLKRSGLYEDYLRFAKAGSLKKKLLGKPRGDFNFSPFNERSFPGIVHYLQSRDH